MIMNSAHLASVYYGHFHGYETFFLLGVILSWFSAVVNTMAVFSLAGNDKKADKMFSRIPLYRISLGFLFDIAIAFVLVSAGNVGLAAFFLLSNFVMLSWRLYWGAK